MAMRIRDPAGAPLISSTIRFWIACFWAVVPSGLLKIAPVTGLAPGATVGFVPELAPVVGPALAVGPAPVAVSAGVLTCVVVSVGLPESVAVLGSAVLRSAVVSARLLPPSASASAASGLDAAESVAELESFAGDPTNTTSAAPTTR